MIFSHYPFPCSFQPNIKQYEIGPNEVFLIGNIFNPGGKTKLSGAKDFKVDARVDKKSACSMSIFSGVV